MYISVGTFFPLIPAVLFPGEGGRRSWGAAAGCSAWAPRSEASAEEEQWLPEEPEQQVAGLVLLQA